ncbi:MAG: glycosyltransferase [Sphingomonas sp.]
MLQVAEDRLLRLWLTRELVEIYIDLRKSRRKPYEAQRSAMLRQWRKRVDPTIEGPLHDTLDATIAEAQRQLDVRDRRQAIFQVLRALDQKPRPQDLRTLSQMLRRVDLIELPRDIYRLSLLHPLAPLALSNVRHYRNLDGWTKERALGWQPPLLAPSAAPPAERALYCLWRSVPHDTNGYATRSHYLLRGLSHVGADVAAVTRFGYPWDMGADQEARTDHGLRQVIDGVPYYRLGSAIGNRRHVPTDYYLRECALRIAHLARLLDVKLIHSASNWMVGYPAALAAEMLGLPFVYEVRGLWEITRYSADFDYLNCDHYELFHRMETETVKRAALVLPITQAIGAELVERGAVDPGRLRIVPNGVEAGRFEPRRAAWS